MKKLLLLAFATIFAMPLMAATIYSSENGKNNVSLYGNIRASIGYGFRSGGIRNDEGKGFPSISTEGQAMHQFNYGLQGNSRLGVTVSLGAFTGQVEFGANEKTLVNQDANAVGIRQAWASWAIAGSANKYGNLSFGKMDSPTSMGGFISTGWDADNSLLGYGGSISSMRRFQIQYAIKGFQVALIEKEAGMRDYSIRPAIAYSFIGDGLKGKVGATFQSATKNAKYGSDAVSFGVTFGIKKQFNDLFSLAFIARVGLNENRYGETGDRWDDGTFNAREFLSNDGFRAGFAFEFALTPIKILGINIGVGYQATLDLGSLTPNTFLNDLYDDLQQAKNAGYSTTQFSLKNAVAIYLRLPIRLDAHWQLVPEVGAHVNVDIYNTSASKNGEEKSMSGSGSRYAAYLMLQMISTF